MIEVRVATPSDATGILNIYGAHVLKSFCTFESEIPSPGEMEKRIEKCIAIRPWVVCVIDGVIAGYVYASAHRERAAYQWSCECSVYINNDFQRIGIGLELYRLLFDMLKILGYRNVYAGITLPNEASIGLHEKCSFTHFATYDNVGYKFGQWKAVGWWKLKINEYDPTPSPPLKFSETDPKQCEELFKKASDRISKKLAY